MKSNPVFRFLLWFAATGALVLLVGVNALWAAPPSDATVNIAPSVPLDPTAVLDSTQTWTRWNPTQYALAEDAQSLWIGAAGGVVRWDKASQTHRRYSAVDGLPHQNVYAVAIDAAGNRWFGGDGGLSRLDAANQWSHFTVANSGLHANRVDAIAVGADGTLWLGHGQTDGSVSRRNADGSWQWIPSRAVAVATDYVRIQQTQNANPLWTVAGDQIWVGYAVYDGVHWIDRTPPEAPAEPVTVAAGSTGTVWVLPAIGGTVYKWVGAAWSTVALYQLFPFGGGVTSLAVGADDIVWIGWEGRYSTPYSNYTAGYASLADLDAPHRLDRQGPVAALLPAAMGVWAIGPAWLLQPNGTVADFADVPLYPTVTDAVVDGAGLLWLHSQRFAPYSDGVLQTVGDQGDPDLSNDMWTVQRGAPLIMALERTPGGDLWLATYFQSRFTGYDPPQRFHQGTWTTFILPNADGSGIPLTDIFAQDERHTWFAYTKGTARGVLALDDGGTIADPTDDQWRDYPIQTSGTGGSVAIDSLGRLWFGDSGGLYRRDGAAWRSVSQAYIDPKGICDLTPAASGVLFVQIADPGAAVVTCDSPTQVILMVQADERMTTVRVDQLVREHLDLVRSANHRNRLWSVAPDGAVWYLLTDITAAQPEQMHRRSATELNVYPLPFARTAARNLEIDPYNHVWLVADASLWRMTARPDFTLTVSPVLWLLAPGDSWQGSLVVGSQGGFTDAVGLAVNGLPTGVTAQLTPPQVGAGQHSVLTLQVAADAPLGSYPVAVVGTSATLTHSTPLTVMLVAEVYESILPVVGNSQVP